MQRLSETTELLSWFREGLRQQGRTHEEVDVCTANLLAEVEREQELARRVRRRRLNGPMTVVVSGQLTLDEEER